MDAYTDNFDNLPFDLEAEQSVLGALLLDSSCMPTVLEYLNADCFYKEQHRAHAWNVFCGRNHGLYHRFRQSKDRTDF